MTPEEYTAMKRRQARHRSYMKHRAERLEYQKAYNREHKDKRREYQREYMKSYRPPCDNDEKE